MEHTQSGNASNDLPTDRRALLAGIGGLAAGAFLAGKAHAGPLNPPPGPIAPTPGPEPRTPVNAQNTPGNKFYMYRISQPGSYYLTENLMVKGGLGGIGIESDQVTLDLNGFAVIGLPGSDFGIGVSSPFNNTIIRNGTIRGLGSYGVLFSITVNGTARCENLTIIECGIDGMITFAQIDVIDCIASNNQRHGFNLGNNSAIHRCIARSNAEMGFRLGNVVTAVDCRAIRNGDRGIRGLFGCTIRNCLARENTLEGIYTEGGSTVEACNVTLNGGHGIVIGGDGTARRNDCAANGREYGNAGIFCPGQDTRIEENNCTNNGIGIWVQGVRNTIIRNTCSANLGVNYQFAAGNRYGPVIDLRGGASPAVSGSTAADTTATTHPWANFAL